MRVKGIGAVLLWIAVFFLHGGCVIKADVKKEVWSLQDIQGSGDYILMNDLRLSETWEIASNEMVTIDLNGYELSCEVTVSNAGFSAAIINAGILTIQDTSKQKTGTLVSKALFAIMNQGQLFIKGGTLKSEAIDKRVKGKKKGSGVLLNEKALTIYGGIFLSKGSVLKTTAESTTVIHDGIFRSGTSRHIRAEYLSPCIQNEGRLFLNRAIIQGNGGALRTTSGEVYVWDETKQKAPYRPGNNPDYPRHNKQATKTRRMLSDCRRVRRLLLFLERMKGRNPIFINHPPAFMNLNPDNQPFD